MDVIEGIKNRRSIRKYNEQAVSSETIQELLDLAVWAPSASNAQPWGFVVIQDRDIMKDLSDRAKAVNLELMKTNIRLQRYQGNLENPHFNIFFNAPALILIYGKKDHPYTQNDCSMAAQNLMLAAWEKGLGTCWIGFATTSCNSTEFKEQYNIADDYVLVAPIVVGYREDVKLNPVPRNKYPVFTWIG